MFFINDLRLSQCKQSKITRQVTGSRLYKAKLSSVIFIRTRKMVTSSKYLHKPNPVYCSMGMKEKSSKEKERRSKATDTSKHISSQGFWRKASRGLRNRTVTTVAQLSQVENHQGHIGRWAKALGLLGRTASSHALFPEASIKTRIVCWSPATFQEREGRSLFSCLEHCLQLLPYCRGRKSQRGYWNEAGTVSWKRDSLFICMWQSSLDSRFTQHENYVYIQSPPKKSIQV